MATVALAGAALANGSLAQEKTESTSRYNLQLEEVIVTGVPSGGATKLEASVSVTSLGGDVLLDLPAPLLLLLECNRTWVIHFAQLPIASCCSLLEMLLHNIFPFSAFGPTLRFLSHQNRSYVEIYSWLKASHVSFSGTVETKRVPLRDLPLVILLKGTSKNEVIFVII